jgi:glycosyltransferase involved in cell wall biosynthesis
VTFGGVTKSNHVVHIVPALFGSQGVVGGAERYVLELAKHMADVTRTTLVTFGKQDETMRVGGLTVEVYGNPWYVKRQQANPFALRAIVRAGKADVVHCHQQHILSSSFAAAYCRLASKRVFVSDLGGGGWDISAYVSTDKWFDGHLHISEYSRQLSGHASKPWAHVILGGVDANRFSPKDDADTLDREDPPVLFVGRLLPHKGVDDLIRAMPDDCALNIVGPAPNEKYFAFLRSLAGGKRVHFHTNSSDEDLVKFYRSALCIVLPSVYKSAHQAETKVPELLGQTLLEGMACELPAICTDVASLPEVVVDGITGFVVPPNDPDAIRQKVEWLRSHRAEAKAMGQAARQRVLSVFTWPAVVSRCLEIYSAVQ